MKTVKKKKHEERWQIAQSKEGTFWERDGVLGNEMQRVLTRYRPVIERISRGIAPDSRILDVGSGPTCPAQLFASGRKTYLDPLMDSYLKTHAGELPEGEKISGTAENIPGPDESFDVVLCVNALDHMIHPDKALAEMHRVLKNNGTFLLGLFLHPPFIAAARMFIERRLPVFSEDAHPYSFTLKSIQELLSASFYIKEKIRVFRKDSALIPTLHREDWMFVCKKK